MSTHTNHIEINQPYFCTITCHRWLPLFEEAIDYKEVYNWFDHLVMDGCQIIGYVIMPNHIHCILFPTNPEKPLNKLISEGKRFMAYGIVKQLKKKEKASILDQLKKGVQQSERLKGKKHQVFRLSFDAKMCMDETMLEQKLDYVHNNPVVGKWKLAHDFTMYEHSSAPFYENDIANSYITHYKEVNAVEYSGSTSYSTETSEFSASNSEGVETKHISNVMKKQVSLIMILLLSCLVVFSQHPFPKKELCEELKQRTLVVELLDEVSESERFLNQALKTEFEAWKINPVVFKTRKEVEQIVESKDTEYAVLTQKSSVREDVRSRKVDQSGKLVIVPQAGQPTFKQHYTAFTFSFYNFDLKLISEEKQPVSITRIGFANGDLSKLDYVYLVQQLTNLVQSSLEELPLSDFYNPEENIAQIKDIKLLILKDFIKEKEIKDIPKLFKYEYALVDIEQYQKAIIDKKEGIGYVKIIWSNQLNMYEWVVVNTSDGKILSQMGFGGVKFGTHHQANEIIKVKHLKYTMNSTAQKMNNKYK